MFNINNTNFDPQVSPVIISFDEDKEGKIMKETYKAICAIWKEAGWNNSIPVTLDKTNKRIVTHLTPSQLREMGSKYPVFKDIIYYNNMFTIFDGYKAKYNTDFPTIDLGVFGDTAKMAIDNLPLTFVEVQEPTTQEGSRADQTMLRWLTTEGFQGALIGEFHEDKWPKAFLVENMARLREAGVTTIFLEFLGEEQQAAIDSYLNSEVPDIMPPPEVLAIIRSQDDHYELPQGSRFIDILSAAKMHGIRVVGMENEASKQYGFDPRYGTTKSMRNIGLHHVAKTIIDREKGEGKYVALVGNGHIRKNTGTPGLSEILGAPAMLLIDEKIINDARVKKGFNVNAPLKQLNGLYHAVFAARKALPLISAYVGMDQRGAEDRLLDCPVGAWLIREGVTVPGTYVLVVKEADRIIQRKVNNREDLIHNIKISTTLDPDLQQLP
jgi:hypothetical protein